MGTDVGWLVCVEKEGKRLYLSQPFSFPVKGSGIKNPLPTLVGMTWILVSTLSE